LCSSKSCTGVKNNYDLSTKISIVYISTIGTFGALGTGIGSYDAFQSSKNSDFFRNVMETTIGSITGFVFGTFFGVMSPILIPIGCSVAISRNFTTR
jgi:hypothetical protein